MPCGHKELYLAINFLPCFRLLYIFICGILHKILQGTNGHAFRRIPYMLYHYFFDRHRGASASLFPRAQPERQGSDPEICGNRHRRHTRQLRLGRILNPRACGSLCEYSVPDLFLQPGYVYAPDQRAYPEQRGSCFSVDFHFAAYAGTIGALISLFYPTIIWRNPISGIGEFSKALSVTPS